MRYWLQPPHRDEVLRPIVHFAVILGVGGSLVAIVVHKVLGITNPDASSAILFAYAGTSFLLYALWMRGIERSSFQSMLEQLGMTKGRLVRRAVVWAVGSGGALLLFNFWPGQEPWPTLIGFSFLGAVVALEVAAWGWRD